MKYQSELIKEILEARGHKQSSLHYESECTETWIEEAKGAYPKLCDYQSEWLNYISILDDTGGEDPEPPIGEFPYVALTNVTEAAVDNVVPLAYKSAILKGSTKYRDIDTGDILDTFDETKNLELVSVKVPVLITYANLFTGFITKGYIEHDGQHLGETNNDNLLSDYIEIFSEHLSFRRFKKDGTPVNSFGEFAFFDSDKKCIDRRISLQDVDESITVPKNTKYIRVWSRPTDDEIDEIAMLILSKEKPSTIMEYQPCKTNILTVNEDVTLCGIGDVYDTLDCLTGEVTERIGEIVLNGSDDERWGVASEGDITNGFSVWKYVDMGNTSHLICDKLNYYESNSLSNDKTNFICYKKATKIIIVNIKNLKSINEVKQWLSQNPITIQYQLATESIKTVDLNIQDQDGKTLSVIKPIEGTMNLSTSSDTIKPLFSGEIPVEAITQNLASFIDLGTDNDLETEE